MRFSKWIVFNLIILTIFLFGLSKTELIAANGKISLEAKVDKNKIKIGDLIQYSIIVARDESVNVEMPDLGANLGAFEIRDYNDLDPEKQNREIVQRREYTISTYDVGDYEIPRSEVPGGMSDPSFYGETALRGLLKN